VVARARIALWPQLDDSFDTLAAGLRRTYRDGRRAFRTARTPGELHEWRKHAKTHWYHVQLLRRVWPAMFEPYADVMQSLSRALGDHHDLHVLEETIPDAPPELSQAIETRQQKLEHEARATGARIYAERPEAWLARMRNLWNAWR
jgi:CHAD domain-containing protein